MTNRSIKHKISPKNILIFSLILLFSCKKSDQINGIWERQNDFFKGMRVEIKSLNDYPNGLIIFSPDSAILGGFVTADVKWKDIRKLNDKNYEFEDLTKSVDDLGKIHETEYSLSRLVFLNDSIITIRGYTKGKEWIGTEQTWKRVSLEK